MLFNNLVFAYPSLFYVSIGNLDCNMLLLTVLLHLIDIGLKFY